MFRHIGTPRAWSYLGILLTCSAMAFLSVALLPRMASELTYTLESNPPHFFTRFQPGVGHLQDWHVHQTRETCTILFFMTLALGTLLCLWCKRRQWWPQLLTPKRLR